MAQAAPPARIAATSQARRACCLGCKNCISFQEVRESNCSLLQNSYPSGISTFPLERGSAYRMGWGHLRDRLPVLTLAQIVDVRDMMSAVPSIQGQQLVQPDFADFWVGQHAAPSIIRERAQEHDPSLVECFE